MHRLYAEAFRNPKMVTFNENYVLPGEEDNRIYEFENVAEGIFKEKANENDLTKWEPDVDLHNSSKEHEDDELKEGGDGDIKLKKRKNKTKKSKVSVDFGIKQGETDMSLLTGMLAGGVGANIPKAPVDKDLARM